MFDRIKYKKFAKIQLKGRWATPVLMTLICAAVMLVLQIPDGRDFVTAADNILDSAGSGAFGTCIERVSRMQANPADTLRGWLEILVGFIFTAAQIHVYLKMSRAPHPVRLDDFMEGFCRWGRAVLAGLWQALWISLWTLLFVIPGIVKYFAYSQTFYLVTEYPGLSVRRAMKISIAVTRGHKGELFLMHLSFIGWTVLAWLTFGIGYLWLLPYRNMSFTNAYHGLLRDALSAGIIKSEDLIG